MGLRAVLAIWLAVSAATASAACEAQLPEFGLQGRSAELPFSNRKGVGSHEHWAGRDDTLRMYAAFARETDEYGHNILGSIRDAKGLTIHIRKPGDTRITCPAEVVLPPGEVFEDIAPRLADVDGDGLPEVIVVHSDAQQGARLAIYDRRARLVAATPQIGKSFRWLAPFAIADLDGDGRVEIAYIDRPHLAKRLRVWRFQNGALRHVADLDGLTNHRIGDEVIFGGLRDCGAGPEMITADGSWSQVMATRLTDDRLQSAPVTSYSGPASLNRALHCG